MIIFFFPWNLEFFIILTYLKYLKFLVINKFFTVTQERLNSFIVMFFEVFLNGRFHSLLFVNFNFFSNLTYRNPQRRFETTFPSTGAGLTGIGRCCYNIEVHLKKNLLASLAHSHRAQLASLARMSAPRTRDLMVVALRAPTYMNFALRAQCYVLHRA